MIQRTNNPAAPTRSRKPRTADKRRDQATGKRPSPPTGKPRKQPTATHAVQLPADVLAGLVADPHLHVAAAPAPIGPAHGSSMLLREFFERVYQPEMLADASDGGSKQYRYCVNALERWLKRPPKVSDLTEETLQGYVSASAATDASPVTINKTVGRLLTLSREAARRKLIATVPHVRLRRTLRRLPTAWSLAEMERMILAARETVGVIEGVPAGKWWPAFLLVLYDTGLRVSSALPIRFSEIDFNEKLLRVPPERIKNGVEQFFRLSDQTVEAIIATLPPERPVVFPWPFVEMASLRKRFRWILEDADLPCSRRDMFHKLRRTCASHLAKHGGIDKAIRQLGHQDPSCIHRYIDPRFTNDHEGAKLLPRPAWDNPRPIVVEPTQPEPKPTEPDHLKVSKAAIAGEGPAVLAELRAKRDYDRHDLRRAMELLRLYVEDFAVMLDIGAKRLSSFLSGRLPISRRVKQRFRQSLGLTYSKPKRGADAQ